MFLDLHGLDGQSGGDKRTAGPGPVGAGRQKDLPAPVEPDAGWVS